MVNHEHKVGSWIPSSWTIKNFLGKKYIHELFMKSDVGSLNEELDIHEPTSKVHDYHEPISKVHEPTVWLHEQFMNLTKTFMNQ